MKKHRIGSSPCSGVSIFAAFGEYRAKAASVLSFLSRCPNSMLVAMRPTNEVGVSRTLSTVRRQHVGIPLYLCKDSSRGVSCSRAEVVSAEYHNEIPHERRSCSLASRYLCLKS